MAIALSCRLDVDAVRAGEQAKVHLVLETRADVAVVAERRRQRTVLAIDVSSSMQGAPIAHVVSSTERIALALSMEDELGVVAFADEATEIVPPTPADDAGKRLVRSRVTRLFAEGRTNVEAGLRLAAKLAGTDGGVVLLSDGAPNVGAIGITELRAVAADLRGTGVSLFALGYGEDHSEDVLSAIGEAGGGGYAYVPDPSQCARAFARAVGAQGDAVATGIELAILPAEGVVVGGFVARESTRFSRDGIVVRVPDALPGARCVVVAELDMRAPEAFLASVAAVTLRYRDASGTVRSRTVDVTVEVADRAPRATAVVADVLLARADRVRADARGVADQGHFEAAAGILRALLRDMQACPAFAIADGSRLAEAYETVLDEANALERRPDPEAYAAFRKSQIGLRVALDVPRSAAARGPNSARLLDHAVGEVPKAALVGDRRYALGAEQAIGRSAAADIALVGEGVARLHAEIYVESGAHVIVDLGTTMTTLVNDARVGKEPRRLTDGDVVQIGDVTLRYVRE